MNDEVLRDLPEPTPLTWRGALIADMTQPDLVALIRDELFPALAAAAVRQRAITDKLGAMGKPAEPPAIWSPH